MENSNPNFIPDSELNKDLYLGLSRRIKISYYLDWIGFFRHYSNEKNPHSEEIMEFLYRKKKEAKNIIENTDFHKENYELTRLAYMKCYEKLLKDLNKIETVPSSLYKVETLIKALVSIQFAYTAFKNQDYYIGIRFYERYNSYTFHINGFNGFSPEEVQDQGWHRKERGKNIAQYELMDKGVSIALSVLNDDKEKNLTSTDIAKIVEECLKSIQNKKVPEFKQIRENWLTDKRFDDRKKKGRPKGKAEDKAKLRDKITENIINNYQHSVG
ncbi:hypothetical protein [Psychrobacter cibarius]|uniref:hypothetical protein n=1 Tax=Psychrobacter cibarius TaxID=282669 RepID=UPI00191B2D50|nr:hypothetical protein [Psychrobacter cibarius]